MFDWVGIHLPFKSINEKCDCKKIYTWINSYQFDTLKLLNVCLVHLEYSSVSKVSFVLFSPSRNYLCVYLNNILTFYVDKKIKIKGLRRL